MKMERIWCKEARKRSANEARRDRINRNWPIHAERVALVFEEFQRLAEGDGVHVIVTPPEWLIPLERRSASWTDSICGSSAVILQFGMQPIGERITTTKESGRTVSIDYEMGAKLVVHHSEVDAIVQVFFEAPRQFDEDRPEPLLFTHTYNTDDVTYDWVAGLISSFLVFNRFESRLQDYSLVDSWRVRWWRFRDIRNRRGYLESFHHIFTPWELVVVAVVAAIPVLGLLKLYTG